MRKEALIGLSVLLVAVSGSATVLDSFGVISGEASVEGPTFWVGENDKLYLEEQEPGSTATGDTFGYELSSPKTWYDMNVDMYANVAEDSGNSESNQVDVKFKFEALDSEGNLIDSCNVVETDIDAEKTNDGIDNVVHMESEDCMLDIGNTEVENFEYMIEANSTGNQLNLQRYGNTRVEVNAQ